MEGVEAIVDAPFPDITGVWVYPRGDDGPVEVIFRNPVCCIVLNDAIDNEVPEFKQGHFRVQPVVGLVSTRMIVYFAGYPAAIGLVEQTEVALDAPFPIGTIRGSR